MKNYLLWLIPPLVGAVIGYVTNAVAIKMLFRPLNPVFFFRRFRLPFTPGILPRQRHKLADSIGAMVERELLTAEILRQRIHRGDVREGLNLSVARYTEKALGAPLERMASGRDELLPLLGPMVRDFFASPAFDFLADAFLRSLLEGVKTGEGALSRGLLNRSLREMLGEESAEGLGKTLEGLIMKGVSASAGKLPGLFDTAMTGAFPGMSAALIRFLNRPEVHGELEVQGRIFLNNAILKLNVFQRLFISAASYDRTLHERMPEIIDDLIRQCEELLGDGQVRERLTSFLQGLVQGLLMEKSASQGLVRMVGELVGAYLDRPLGELLPDRGEGRNGELVRKLYGFLKQNGAGGLDKTFAAAFRALLEARPGLSLGEFLSIDGEKKKKLDAFLSDKLLAAADNQIEVLLKTIQVRTLVSERIDSLNMIDVERIVLDVMANQLQWINLFGAILGALIGAFQSAFTWFTRGL
jgi:uncharacterized membrane protein YheB (UPF0754 family)